METNDEHMSSSDKKGKIGKVSLYLTNNEVLSVTLVQKRSIGLDLVIENSEKNLWKEDNKVNIPLEHAERICSEIMHFYHMMKNDVHFRDHL